MIEINNDWFTYNKEKDRFETRITILTGVPITPGAMQQIANSAKEMLEAREAMK